MTDKKKTTKLGRPKLLERFGPYLNARRTEKGWPLRKLAQKAGCAHTNIFQFEKLQKNPTLTELAALAKAFKQSLMKFLEPLT